MKFAQFFTRLLAVVFICGSIVFANVNPAIAAYSDPDKGMQELSNIQTQADNAVKASPYDDNAEYRSNGNSNQGLNEIQGTADFDKMKSTPNDNTLPVVKQAEKALDKAGDKMKSAKDDTKNSVDSVLDKAGDMVNSLTGKAEKTVKSIKDKIKS